MKSFLEHLTKGTKSGIDDKMVDKKGDSPQSIPSLAETSFASSHEGDGVSRALFVNSESKPFPKAVVENIEKLSEDIGQEVSAYGSDISITSSETTAVVTRNLTLKDTNDAEEDGQFTTLSKDCHAKQTNVPSESSNQAMVVYEEPPEESRTCISALSLTPKQLAEIFLSFERARKIWPMMQSVSKDNTVESPASSPTKKETVSNEDAEKSPTFSPKRENQESSSPMKVESSTSRAESLEIECLALKQIIQDDSSKMVNLRRAMEAQRELNTLKDIEIEDRQAELQHSEERLDLLSREKATLQEREAELEETIRILKEELDFLSKTKTDAKAFAVDKAQEGISREDDDEMKNLRFDLRSFSSQVVEQDQQIEKLLATLQEREEENRSLQSDVKSLKGEVEKLLEEQSLRPECEEQRLQSDNDKITEGEHGKLSRFLEDTKRDTAFVGFYEFAEEDSCSDETSDEDSEQLPSGLEAIIAGISKRLEAIEREKNQTEIALLEELKRKEKEIDEIRAMMNLESTNISQNSDGIEVFFPQKNSNENQPSKESQKESIWCCQLL